MDFHYVSTQKQNQNNTTEQNNKRLTKEQIRLLETSFNSSQKLQGQRKLEIATRLGLSPRQVAIWYQNRRARRKTQTIESDNKTIQLKLDKVLAEKSRLEEEVSVLKEELNKAQNMLQLLTSTDQSLTNFHPSFGTSGDDDHASSSTPNNSNYCPDNALELQMEALYTYLPDWP